MKVKYISIVVLFTVMISMPCLGRDTEKEAEKIYRQAKKKSINQKWQQALELYQELVLHYPHSSYVDDSYFWVGYCIQQQGKLSKAYAAFKILKKPEMQAGVQEETHSVSF